MSINHYSSDHWWSHYVMDSSARTSSSNQKPASISNSTHFVPNSAASFWLTSDHHHASAASAAADGPMFCGKNSAFGINLNNEDEEELQLTTDDRENCNNSTSCRESEQDQEQEVTRDPLFEKPLTPSDVGKLNRLVIPKQHAEKHFPLNGGGGGESGENGLLLSFEDEVGKSWRFRYSYWNSSQSYVLTKGWSRFVKEKRLDAGDIVIFLRHRVDAGRLFIGWRRRNSGVGQDSSGVSPPTAAVASGGGGWSRVYYSGRPYNNLGGPSSLSYNPDQCLYAGSSFSQNQTTAASGNSKRLRLFGVNLECQADESEPSTPVGSPMSSQGQAHQHLYHQYYSNHMDIGFSGADVYRQG